MDIIILLARLGLAAAHGAQLASQLRALPVSTEISEGTLSLLLQEIETAIGMAQQALPSGEAKFTLPAEDKA